MIDLALFDFDGTITKDDSLLKFIRFVVGDGRFVFGLVVLSPILVAYKLKLIPNYKAKQKMLSWFFKGMSKEAFLKVLKVFFITWIILIVLISSLSSFIPPTKPAFKSKNFTGRLLPSQSGKQKGNYIVAQSGTSPGFITYGPYIELPEGSYSFDISYISSENNTTTVGTWDTGLALPKEFKQLKKGYLLGTNDKDGHIIQTFVIPKEHSNQKVEIRNFYNGTGNLTIKSLTITKVE